MIKLNRTIWSNKSRMNLENRRIIFKTQLKKGGVMIKGNRTIRRKSRMKLDKRWLI